MKKNIVGLLLFLMIQNFCGMELDSLAMGLNNNEKCKWVARYLHKYPAGKNKEEAGKIKRFFDNKTSQRSVLLQRVNVFGNMLKNIEAEEMLHGMHTHDLPSELKQKIFTYALWGYATQCYVLDNTCKFVAMEYKLVPPHCHGWIRQYYIPCFLAEIYEDLYYPLFFSKTAIDSLVRVKADNDLGIHSSDFDKEDRYKVMYSTTNVYCCTKNNSGLALFSVPVKSTNKILRDLVFFLDAKKSRMLAFKQLFNKSIEELALMNGTEGVNRFIELLAFYKALPHTIACIYESMLHRSASELLQDLAKHDDRFNRRPPF